MSLYDNVKQIAKTKGYSINRLEQELGFARSYISKFKTITPSADKIQKIADFLGVSSEYLLTGTDKEGLTTCKECGLLYDSSYPYDVEIHKKQHEAYKKAEKKFGEIYGYYPEREQIKAENRKICENSSLPLEQRVEAQLKVLRCLFSRSLEICTYDLNHVNFDTYVAMMLKNPSYCKNIDNDLYQVLVSKYGTLPGIESGTVYHKPKSKVYVFNSRDERDIKKDLDSIMEKLNSGAEGPAAYDGEPLDPEAADLFKDELEIALRRLKLINKEKYTPKKYKK